MYQDFDRGLGRERTAQMRKEVEVGPGLQGPALRLSGVRDEAPLMPKFEYHLDESDADVLVLRRQDGAFVAAFSARGATREGILEAAEDDYRALLREHAGPLGLDSAALRSRSV